MTRPRGGARVSGTPARGQGAAPGVGVGSGAGTSAGWVPAALFFLLFSAGIFSTFLESFGLGLLSGSADFGFRAWENLAVDPWLRRSLLFTLYYSLASALLSAFLGTGAAFLLWKRKPLAASGGARLWLALPHITVGFLVVIAFSPFGLVAALLGSLGFFSEGSSGGLVRDPWGLGLILAYVLKESAFVSLWVRAALARVDPRLAECASMLGAGPWRTFRLVLLPYLAPASLSAGLIVFLYALGAWELPYLLGPGNPQALSVFVFDVYTEGELTDRPDAAAVLSLLAFFSLALAFLFARRRLGR